MKYSHRLILLYSALLLVSYAVIALVVQSSTATILGNQIRASLEEGAFHTMQAIDRMLYERYLDLRGLAADPVLVSRDSTPQELTQHLHLFRKTHPFYTSLSLFDLERIRIADTEGRDIGQRHPPTEYWAEIGAGSHFVLAIAESSTTKTATLYGAQVVKDETGTPCGVVVGSMPVEILHEIVRRHLFTTGAADMKRMELLDKEGRVLFSNYDQDAILRKVSEDWEDIKHLVKTDRVAGSERHVWRGEEEISAFSRERGYREFTGNGWILLLCTPAETALIPLAGQRELLLRVFLIVGGFALIAVVIVAKGMTKPLRTLSRAAREIGTGNLDARVDFPGGDEIGELAQAFNAMAADLKAGERRYRDLAELLPQVVYEIDDQGQVLFANRRGLTLFGYTDADLTRGLSITEVFVPEEAGRIREHFERAMRGETLENMEYTARKKDGTTFPFLSFSVPVVRDDAVVGMRGIGIDISERKRAERQIEQAKQEWERTFDAIKEPLMILDAGHRIVRANRSMAEKLHVTPDEARGAFCYEAVHGLAQPPEFCPHAKLLADGLPHDVEIYEERLAGHYYISVSPLHTPDGVLYGSVHYAHEITQQKRAEEDIRRLNEALEQKVEERTRQLVEAQEELVRKGKLAILGQLAGSIGHELRNPLGVMSNAVYYLQTVRNVADDETREYLAIIKAEIENSQRIITDLLDFSRTWTSRKTTVSLPGLVSESLAKCSIPGGIKVRVDVPADLPLLSVDPLQVRQVFQNLFVNAVQAMPGGGSLTIVARQDREAGTVRTRVVDSGEGIPPENVAKLFQPLFTTKARGIGLGLVVSKQLVEANGGRIEVESCAGSGTTFTVILPLCAP